MAKLVSTTHSRKKEITREDILAASGFIDTDGDHNIVLEVGSNPAHHKLLLINDGVTFVRDATLGQINPEDVAEILPPGTQITIEL